METIDMSISPLDTIRANSRIWPTVLLLSWLMLYPLASTAFAVNALGIPDSEYGALVALYNATDGPNWTNKTNWLTESTPWHGITVAGGHVTEIELGVNNLTGQIPPEIGNFTALTYLCFWDNHLSGPIPPEIGNLSNLQRLRLRSNLLTGHIPPQLGQLTNLDQLILSSNPLGGTIPRELGNLANLTFLELDASELTGSIPAELGNLANLQYMYIGANQLSGSIPPELGNLNSVLRLELGYNQLTGSIPGEIGNLSSLGRLDLSFNKLTGNIPAELGNLTSLWNLALSSNQFSGEIPEEIMNLTNLDMYSHWVSHLGYNRLVSTNPDVRAYLADNFPAWDQTQTVAPTNISATSGAGSAILAWTPIAYSDGSGYYEVGISSTPGGPYDFLPKNRTADKAATGFTVTGLPVGTHYLIARTVSLAGWNNLSDLTSDPSAEVQVEVTEPGNALGVPWSEYNALVALYNATDGPNWYTRTNWLTEEVPWHGVTVESGHVTAVDLYNNNLVGSIPAGLGNLTSLRSLGLVANYLSGSIPPELGNLANLQALYLHWNHLTGSIPPELGNLSSLQTLSLSNNELTGPIPAQIADLASLHSLYLDSNQLSGTLPTELGQLTNLHYLILNTNQLSGEIPVSLSNLSNLLLLDLSYNQLSGYIPASLGSMTNLERLRLDGNELIGEIPNTLAGLTNLYELALSSNQFDGGIPRWLGSMSGLRTLELQYCGLTGEMPTELGNLVNLTALYLGGNQLTGAIPAWLGDMSALTELYLHGNQLSGQIPPELGSMTNLQALYLYGNQLRGEIPHSIVNLTNMGFWSLDLSYNALLSTDPEVISYLETRTPGWVDSQTVPPTNVTAVPGAGAAIMSWTPIAFGDGEGYYEVGFSSIPGGPYTFLPGNRTTDKYADGLDATLLPIGTHYLVVRTVSLAGWSNQSDLTSELSAEVQVQVTETGNVLGVPDSEYDALVALYNGTDGPNWTNKTNWLTENRPWYGVETRGGHIAEISLCWNNLSGPIPAEIGNLSGLQELSMMGNRLTGSIPAQIGNLSTLASIDLYDNQLSGGLPPEMGHLTALRYLDLGANQLSGAMPTELSNLTDLTHLDLYGNQLTGAIPSWLGSLANLTSLHLQMNDFAGQIPMEIWNLVNLEGLSLGSNDLTGGLPPQIGNLVNLRYLQLEYCQLSGSIPPEIGNLSSLTDLRLYANQFTGPIPPEIGNLSYLGWLFLSDNQLTGNIPSEIGNLGSLWLLSLDRNNLSGQIPSWIGSMTGLQELGLAGNRFTGEVPHSIVNLTSLYVSDYWTTLDYNSLVSTDPEVRSFLAEKFPSWERRQTVAPTDVTATTSPGSVMVSWTPILYTDDIGYYEVGISSVPGGPYEFLPQNRTANKSASSFAVTMLPIGTYYLAVRAVTSADWHNPSTLTSDPSAEVSATVTEVGTPLGVPQSEYDALVALYNATGGDDWYNRENWLTANTPWCGVVVSDGHVTRLALDANNLTGSIPAEIGDLPELREIYFSGNSLTGAIPPQIGNLTKLEVLWASGTPLTSIPPEIGNLASLRQINLQMCQLSGELPMQLWTLSNLAVLLLNGNDIVGTLPPQIGNLTELYSLSLSHNRFSGQIPSEIGNLTDLQGLSLGSNQFIGDVPSSITGLTYLGTGLDLSLSYNALSASDPAVKAYLDTRAPGWADTQTVPPTNVSAQIVQPGCVVVSWTPIAFTGDGGYYEVGVSASPGGPYTFSEWNRTGSKSASSTMVADIPSGSELYFVVRTVTEAGYHNASQLTSRPSSEISVPDPGRAMKIGQAKLLEDGEAVVISNVSAMLGWLETPTTIKAYIQEWDRSAGIAIRLPASMEPDTEDQDIVALSLTGTMATLNGERFIDVSSIYFAYGEEPDIRPLGIGSLSGSKGLDITGLGIRTWGKVIESSAYSAGVHPSSFRMSDASGEFTVLWPQDYGEIDDNRILVPALDTSMRVEGVCSGIPGEKLLYYHPEYEIDALGSWNNLSGRYGAYAVIEENTSHATAMAVSGPGIDGWRDMTFEYGEWRSNWPLPDPAPAAPIEYLFRITDSQGERTFRGWVTGYIPTYQTNMSPAQGSQIMGPLTFSWSLPSTGGPYHAAITLYRSSPTFYWFDAIEVESGSSVTFTSPELTSGDYTWQLTIFDKDGSGISAGSASFHYGM